MAGFVRINVPDEGDSEDYRKSLDYGDTPVVIDQPEDALHAPWIEDYLVDRLRAAR